MHLSSCPCGTCGMDGARPTKGQVLICGLVYECQWCSFAISSPASPRALGSAELGPFIGSRSGSCYNEQGKEQGQEPRRERPSPTSAVAIRGRRGGTWRLRCAGSIQREPGPAARCAHAAPTQAQEEPCHRPNSRRAEAAAAADAADDEVGQKVPRRRPQLRLLGGRR